MSHLPEGMSGWRGGRSEGAQSRPQSIFEKRTNPSLSDPTTSRSRGTSKGWEDRDIFSREGFQGRQGSNPDHKCKFQLLGLGRAACPQPASFNIITPKRSARRRRDTPPYLIFNLAKQTQRALQSVGPNCGERDSQGRLLPAIFFVDDCRKAESGF